MGFLRCADSLLPVETLPKWQSMTGNGSRKSTRTTSLQDDAVNAEHMRSGPVVQGVNSRDWHHIWWRRPSGMVSLDAAKTLNTLTPHPSSTRGIPQLEPHYHAHKDKVHDTRHYAGVQPLRVHELSHIPRHWRVNLNLPHGLLYQSPVCSSQMPLPYWGPLRWRPPKAQARVCQSR